MDDIENRFKFHPADTVERRLAHENARLEMRLTARWAEQNLPDGREKALVLTKLEEAMFWANAAIARQGVPA